LTVPELPTKTVNMASSFATAVSAPTVVPDTDAAHICIVGVGPRGTSVVERLCANVDEMAGDSPVRITLIDPYRPGPGRVWRHTQSELLWLNTTAADNTMFPDASVVCDGPVGTGPSFLEWARTDAVGLLSGTPLAAELSRVHPGWFPSRHLYREYLLWTLERAAASVSASVTIEWVEDRAVDVTDLPDGRQAVRLEGAAEPLVADVVILAQGHQEVRPGPGEAALEAFATEHDLAYLPRAYTADADLDRFPPGTRVLVRGGGLAFIDCMVLLFEGRGGRFERNESGFVVYHPSGQEPILYVGSIRGVPFHSKTTYPLGGGRPPLPHYLTMPILEERFAELGPLDFRRDLWPLVSKDLAFGYYHELWHAHPERTTGAWEDLVETLDGATSGELAAGDEVERLITALVPDEADRLDLARLQRPLHGVHFDDPGQLQEWVRTYVAADLARRTDPSYSADLGLIMALLTSFGLLALATAAGWLSARSRGEGVDGTFFNFFSYVASGPPPPRLEQVLALSQAGFVEFLGADLRVTADARTGRFRADRMVGPPISTTALIDARLPAPSVAGSCDPLVANLYRRGEIVEDIRIDEADHFELHTGRVLTDEAHRVVDASSVAHRSRFALGPWTSGGRATSGIARPEYNAGFFRQNDALARTVLGHAVGARRGEPLAH
jgi:hypothetical protein